MKRKGSVKIIEREIDPRGVRISINDEAGTEIAHAYVFILCNDFHDDPFAFVGEVMIAKSDRLQEQRIAKELKQKIMEVIKYHCCYEIIACDQNVRTRTRQFYQDMDFVSNGRQLKLQ